MGLFDDSAKLFNMSFPWGLGRYRPDIDSDPDRDVPPPDVDSISVYIDDTGAVNVDQPIISYEAKDPIDVPVDHTYSKENNFIAQLNKTLTTVPIGGTLLFPTYNFREAGSVGYRFWGWGALGTPQYRGRLRYPNDTPVGFVPCVGQVLRYPDGSVVQVPDLAPPISSWGGYVGGRLGGGYGTSYTPGYTALPAVRWMMRVPEGWSKPDPVLGSASSRYLDEIRPSYVWNYWWGQSL